MQVKNSAVLGYHCRWSQESFGSPLTTLPKQTFTIEYISVINSSFAKIILFRLW